VEGSPAADGNGIDKIEGVAPAVWSRAPAGWRRRLRSKAVQAQPRARRGARFPL
jgi:hypothetical protein